MIKSSIMLEINEYCSVNNIKDIDKLINKMLLRGFTIEKYGETPKKSQIIPEKIEIIKEVEVIKEVEKIVNITDDEEINKLTERIDLLEKEKLEYNQLIIEYKKKLVDKDNEINRIKSKRDFYGE